MLTKKVAVETLKLGEEFPSGIFVTNRWNDPEGVWLETSDGEAGYVDYGIKITIVLYER
jgi:hypothetical protein